jgi:hypothetical protein
MVQACGDGCNDEVIPSRPYAKLADTPALTDNEVKLRERDGRVGETIVQEIAVVDIELVSDVVEGEQEPVVRGVNADRAVGDGRHAMRAAVGESADLAVKAENPGELVAVAADG